MNLQMRDLGRFRKILSLSLAVSIAVASVISMRPVVTARSNSSGAIQFRILKILCIEQTFDLWGDDDIALGGTVASKFGVDMVNYTDLGGFDEDGNDGDGVLTEVTFDDWIFAEIPIDDVTDYTRVQLTLVETDLGGKEEFLARLTEEEYEFVRVEMLAYFIALLEDYQDGIVASTNADVAINPFAWLIGQALQYAASAVIDYILNSLWEVLTHLLQDDFFRVQVVDAPVSSIMALVAAGAQSPSETGSLLFVDHGAVYELEYSWTGVGISTDADRSLDYNPTYRFDSEMEQMRARWESRFFDEKTYFPMISRR